MCLSFSLVVWFSFELLRCGSGGVGLRGAAYGVELLAFLHHLLSPCRSCSVIVGLSPFDLLTLLLTVPLFICLFVSCVCVNLLTYLLTYLLTLLTYLLTYLLTLFSYLLSLPLSSSSFRAPPLHGKGG